MPEVPVRAVAVILESLGPVTYRIALPNGKEIIGYLARDLRRMPPSFAVEDRVRVELTPYDFSKARITGLAAGDVPAEP